MVLGSRETTKLIFPSNTEVASNTEVDFLKGEKAESEEKKRVFFSKRGRKLNYLERRRIRKRLYIRVQFTEF